MPRSRNIKPGLYENDKLAECSIPARYIFPGLWMLADKEGRLEDRPKRIKAQLLPYDNLEITGLLQELHDHSFIVRYTVNGENYIQVVNFTKHQNPHKNEKDSVIPPIPENGGNMSPHEISGNYQSAQVMQQTTPADSLLLIPDSLIPDSHIPEKPGKKKITLHELSTDHVVEWLTEKRCQGKYVNHDEHEILEVFKNYCKANGKRYADYVAAYRNAFDWERFQPQRNPSVVDPPVAPLNKSQQAMQAAMRGVMKNYEIKG